MASVDGSKQLAPAPSLGSVSLDRYRGLADWQSLLLVALLIASLATLGLVQFGVDQILSVSSCVGLVAVASVLLATRGSGWSSARVYVCVLWAFHAPLVLFHVLGLDVQSFSSADLGWFAETDFVAEAARASALGLAAYALGVVVAYGAPTTNHSFNKQLRPSNDEAFFAWFGLSVVSLGVGLWLFIAVKALGPTFFLQSYKEWLTSVEGSRLWLAYLLIILGLAALGSSLDSRLVRAGLVVFVLWGVPAFFMGLRGEVLFPALTFLVARSHRSPVRVGIRGWILALLVLCLAVAAKWIRQGGVGAIGSASLSANPLQALTETGYSLFVTYQLVIWNQVDGEQPLGWGVVLSPFAYAAHVLRLGGSTDNQLQYSLNALIGERLGGYGGSIVAEAFLAFGIVGVIGYLFGIGICLAIMMSKMPTAQKACNLGIVTGLLLIAVRNDSTPIPISLVICGFFMAAAMGIRFLIERFGSAEPRTRSPFRL